MTLNWSQLGEIVARHRIVYGVIFALIIAGLLTSISMALYVSSGASRLDLSRPGYESAREEVVRMNDDVSFEATGPINSEVVDDFQKRFDKHREVINKLDTYGTNALDDTELQIAPNTAE